MLQVQINEEKGLLLRLKKGDRQAFELLYHRYKRKLAVNLLRLVKSEELVEEVLQDLFLKLWLTREKIDPERSFRSYLYRIAHNLVYDMFRKSASDRRLEAYLVSASTELYTHIEEDLFIKEHYRILEDTINKLPPQRRLVFTLCKLEGKSYKEISEELGISHPTINEHIQKANKFLKQQLNPSALLAAMIVVSMLR